MAVKHIFCGCACVLAVGGAIFWGVDRLGAAEPPEAGEQLQPLPDPPAKTPQAEDGELQPYGYVDESVVMEEGGVDYFGVPFCSPPGKYWLRADYLMWWTNGMRLPPLVTTSPQGTPIEEAGVLPGATILYGNETVGDYGRSNFRMSWGVWLDNCHVWGVEGDYFTIGEGTSNYSRYSTGDPILARPFYDVENIQQSRELVAYPDEVEGTITVGVKDYFQSTGVALTYNLCSCDSCAAGCDPCRPPMLFCCRADLLVGYRYYKYNDSVAIREDLRITKEGPTQNWLFQVDDGFRARNDFHGSEFGLRTRVYRGRWSLEVLTKIALGNNHQVVHIDGQTIVTPIDQPVEVRDGGVFAVRTNEGTYTRDTFTMIPQLGVELGYQLNEGWRAYIGYNILYWGCVIHAAEQIDLNVDPRNIPVAQDPALPFPAFPGETTDFWAQGLNVGLEWRF